MDATSDSARKAASREATEWSVLLHDDPDDSDLRRRFEAWRGESALNAAAWENTQRVAHLAAEVLPAYADEWTSAQAAAPAPQKAPVRLRRWGLSAVSMAIAAAIAWLALPDLVLRLEADHLTGTAELRPFQPRTARCRCPTKPESDAFVSCRAKPFSPSAPTGIDPSR